METGIKQDDLHLKTGGYYLPLLPQFEELWSAPFAKVGAIPWKDIKAIQKEMPEFDWYQIVSLMPPNSSWKPGCLNDEVNNCHQVKCQQERCSSTAQDFDRSSLPTSKM